MRSERHFLQRVYLAFTLYLPILLVAVLALATWWLVRQNPLPDLAQTSPAARTQIEYTMQNFATTRYDAQGQELGQVGGRQVNYWSDGQVDIQQAQLQGVRPDGSRILASAQTAHSDKAGQLIELRGQAQVIHQKTTAPSLQVRSERLYIAQKGEHIYTDTPIVVHKEGGDVFSADRMDYQRSSGIFELSGRVRGTLQAKLETAISPP